MSKVKRRAMYAEKLRSELRQRWMRELQESKRGKDQQADTMN